ncbi:hypothetical protein [Brevibacillus laterosporus]|uniref:hypothetical protein n=1 Tax=Brevibacillus laterosporus TaxID=1465 RepID=UPI00215C93F8|nr:hypothetical protein [Brevibacillus laterosporus]MCR8994670.1 hypothetical protein [Brevibacillus laterosporus]
MAIKRVYLENMSISNVQSSYFGFARLWFYDKNGDRIDSGTLLKNHVNLCESEKMYIEGDMAYSSSYPVFNAVDTTLPLSSYDNRYMLSSQHAPHWFQVIFKSPVESLSKFTIDTRPYTDCSIDSVFKVSFYDEFDNLLATYEVDPRPHYREKTKYRIHTIETPELMEKPKFYVLQDVQESGTKNYVIDMIEKSIVPRLWNAEYDRVVSELNTSPAYHSNICQADNVFGENWGLTDYGDYSYYKSSASPNGIVNVFFEIYFHKPQMINAFEFSIYYGNYGTNLKFAVEALDENANEWILLGFFERDNIAQYTLPRFELSNSNYYHRYKITFINIDTYGLQLTTNRMNFYTYEGQIREVSISSGEDYKKKGMSTLNKILTNNLKKVVTQNNKLSFFEGNIFSKKFNLKNEKIRSITI